MTSVTGATRLWAAVAAALALFLGLNVAVTWNRLNAIELAPGSAAAAGEAGEAASAAPVAFDVVLGEFSLEPSSFTAPAGAPLTFLVRNAGALPHDFEVEGVAGTEEIASGGTTALEVPALDPGTYALLCTVQGHAEAGMRGTLVVSEDATTEASAPHDAQAGPAPLTPEEMVAGHMAGIEAFPAETEGKGNQPLEPRIDADGTKVFELTAAPIEWETEPGVFKNGFAYNGQIPGPRIDVDLGDRVRLVLHNELPVPTSIHLHGLVLPVEMDGVPGLTQDAVMTGESFAYEFTVRNAGSHMYHSHFDSAAQVPMGLLGAFIVHDGTEEQVDLDYLLVLNDGPLGYTLNGKGFPATEPIVVELGQKVRIRYMNEGLVIHPMHLHGLPQRVVAKDGYPLAQPQLMDNVLVSPGDRIDVIVEATEPGPWAFHCHILSHAEGPHGMFGMVTALVVTDT